MASSRSVGSTGRAVRCKIDAVLPIGFFQGILPPNSAGGPSDASDDSDQRGHVSDASQGHESVRGSWTVDLQPPATDPLLTGSYGITSLIAVGQGLLGLAGPPVVRSVNPWIKSERSCSCQETTLR